MKYSWKPGHAKKITAEVAGIEFERINKKYPGRLETKHIIEESRAEDAPLHVCFEWDDSVAAEYHRNYQARKLIQCLVVVDVERKIIKPIRAFVYVRDNPGDINESGFRDIYTVLSDEELRKKAVQQAWCELQQWREKYQEYKELAEVFNIVDKKSPCELCPLSKESKNNEKCANCEKRTEYLKKMEAA